MFHLYGFFTQNSRKPLYVLSELGVEFEFTFVNLASGEQRTEEFLQKNPLGKVPVLAHDGQHIRESGAICRYVASVCESPLYPTDKLKRARVDQWLDYFALHLGRWLTTLYFENIIKPVAGLGDPDARSIEEATMFAGQQFKVVDKHLDSADWLANDELSIADLCALAYVEQCKAVGYDFGDYVNVTEWFNRLDSRESVTKARAMLPSGPAS